MTDIDWCCDELAEMTAVHPGRRTKTWNWEPHIAEVYEGEIRLVAASHDTYETRARAINPAHFDDTFDFTFAYCPFCGTEVEL